MSRKNRAPKRDVLPDPLYNSQLVTRLINRVMLDGKRGTAASIVYGAFEQIKEATKSQLKFVQNVVQHLDFVGW